MKREDQADVFARYWRMLAPADAPQPMREYHFHQTRKWRFDFSWIVDLDETPKELRECRECERDQFTRLAVEVDGAQWLVREGKTGRVSVGGRHNTDADREKGNAAAELGWRVMHFSTQQLERDPQACISQVLRALGYQGSK